MKNVMWFWQLLSRAQQRSVVILAVAMAVYVVVGVAIRLTIKDAIPFLAAIYYAVPLPAMTLAAVFAGLLWAFLKRPRIALLSFAIGFTCAWWTYQHTCFANLDQASSSDRCVVFWNVSSGRLGWARVVETLKSQNPDVIGLVESGGGSSEAMARWREDFPDHELSELEGGMLLLSKGRIISDAYGSLGKGGRYKQLALETGTGVLHVFIVDIDSDPLMQRREVLEKLAEITSALGDEPTLVMGDFNTPGDSLHFGALRRTFDNAFESHGNGYSPTWPIPVPVLQLDHIWVNRQIVLSQCKAEWTLISDHRPVTAWLHVTP
jgi:endonuclease/exonuclease/phosphatase (EEP) superfamily protein YafD